MSENQPPEETPVSGSRWEDSEAVPAVNSEDAAEVTTVYPTGEAAAPGQAEPEAPEPGAEVAEDRSRWITGKAALIGAALGIGLLAGAGGFALGAATADDDFHGRFESERGWHGGPQDGRPMPPGPGQGEEGFDRGQRPDFNQDMDPRDDDSGSDDSGSDDFDQDDSSTQG